MLGTQSEVIVLPGVFVLGMMVDDTGRLTSSVTSNINYVTRLHAQNSTKSP